jgi:hypothetical protein
LGVDEEVEEGVVYRTSELGGERAEGSSKSQGTPCLVQFPQMGWASSHCEVGVSWCVCVRGIGGWRWGEGEG